MGRRRADRPGVKMGIRLREELRGKDWQWHWQLKGYWLISGTTNSLPWMMHMRWDSKCTGVRIGAGLRKELGGKSLVVILAARRVLVYIRNQKVLPLDDSSGMGRQTGICQDGRLSGGRAHSMFWYMFPPLCHPDSFRTLKSLLVSLFNFSSSLTPRNQWLLHPSWGSSAAFFRLYWLNHT